MGRYYRFDQLFEKLPDGTYRERKTPAPILGIEHRHDFFRSPNTGRICVLYPAMSWKEAIACGFVTIVDNKPIEGGEWGRGPAKIDWGMRQIDWNEHGISWNS